MVGSDPSSLNRNVLALRARIRPLGALRFGRDHPVTFSAIFFTSSSIGIDFGTAATFIVEISEAEARWLRKSCTLMGVLFCLSRLLCGFLKMHVYGTPCSAAWTPIVWLRHEAKALALTSGGDSFGFCEF